VPDELAAGDKVRVTLTADAPEDYDIDVLRDGVSVGSSAGLPGSVEEVLISDPQPGEYVVRVHYYAAATGAYEIKGTRVTTTRTVTPRGPREAYEMTCETPDGTVVERRQVVVDRGETLNVRLACGGGTGDGPGQDGPPRPGQDSPSRPGRGDDRGPGRDGAGGSGAGGTSGGGAGSPRGVAQSKAAPSRATLRVVSAGRLSGGAIAVRVTCPATVTGACRGTLRLRGSLRGRTAATLGSKAFVVPAGRTMTVKVKPTRALRQALTGRRRVAVTALAQAKAGTTTVSGSRRLLLRR
jgi:hypothetical protein